MLKASKIGFVSLGCSKNTVDSEVMLGHIGRAGGCLTTDPDEADVLVINTCGFVEAAKQESIEAILEAVERKTAGKCSRVVVAGCMVQRYRRELELEIPEVDAFIGLDSLDQVPAAAGLGAPASLPRLPAPIARGTTSACNGLQHKILPPPAADRTFPLLVPARLPDTDRARVNPH